MVQQTQRELYAILCANIIQAAGLLQRTRPYQQATNTWPRPDIVHDLASHLASQVDKAYHFFAPALSNNPTGLPGLLVPANRYVKQLQHMHDGLDVVLKPMIATAVILQGGSPHYTRSNSSWIVRKHKSWSVNLTAACGSYIPQKTLLDAQPWQP